MVITLGRTVATNAVLLTVALGLSVAAYESVLTLVASPEKATLADESVSDTSASQRRAEPADAEPGHRPTGSEAAGGTDDTHSQNHRSGTGCQSAYYAIFESDGESVCARNPTALTARWGPPSEAWFRLLGGEFRVEPGDTASSPLCGCLVKQSDARPDATQSPVSTLVYDSDQAPIAKWVCADPCMPKETSGTNDIAHDF